jgi:signal transduction histidine kinase
VIQDHGGSVMVEGTSQSGTTFLVRLPRAARALPETAQTVVS